ncbi:MAG: tripartite tricarboxylate transporter TctB family protein [Pseudomonadales bacterium]
MGYRLFLLALLVTAVVYTVGARMIPMNPWTAAELVNAQTLPTLYGTVLSVALCWLLFRGGEHTDPPSPYRVLRAGGIGLLTVVFVAALGWIDLWIALAGLIGLSALWLGERRVLPLLALSTLVPLTGYVGIELLLGLYLPD